MRLHKVFMRKGVSNQQSSISTPAPKWVCTGVMLNRTLKVTAFESNQPITGTPGRGPELIRLININIFFVNIKNTARRQETYFI